APHDRRAFPTRRSSDLIVNQIRYNREFPEVKGSMHFSSKTISQNKLGINNKLAEVQPYPALIPSMPWLDPTAPPAPKLTGLSGRSEEHTSELQSRENLV